MGRLLAISDIHGCLEEFNELIDEIKLTKKDNLVILGDVIDRGPHNVDTVFRIMELKANGYDIVNIMGNHEEIFLNAIKMYKSIEELYCSPYMNMLSHNGTINSLIEYFNLSKQEKVKLKLELLSYRNYYKINNFLFVHAGVESNVDLEKQTLENMMWIRNGFVDKESHGFPYTVIFGHTPTSSLNTNKEFKIWRMNDKIGIDCGCVFGGKLACLDLTNNKEYYVDSKRKS